MDTRFIQAATTATAMKMSTQVQGWTPLWLVTEREGVSARLPSTAR